MSSESTGKAIAAGLVTGLLAGAPASAEVDKTGPEAHSESAPALRAGGAPSSAAVDNIMKKWAVLARMEPDSVTQTATTFSRFDTPTHVQVKRP